MTTNHSVDRFLEYLLARGLISERLLKLCAGIVGEAPEIQFEPRELQVLARQGLAPLTVDLMGQLEISCDSAIQLDLAQQAARVQLHLKHLISTLAEILEKLPGLKERLMLIKGLGLDATLYEGNLLRASSDLDLLVSPELSVAEVLESIASSGFCPRPLVASLKRFGIGSIWSAEFSDGEHSIDLHFSIRGHPAIKEPLESIWSNRVWQERLGICVPALEDSQMITLVHTYFDLLNGKLDPKAVVDLVMFWRQERGYRVPDGWKTAGVDELARYFSLFVEQLMLRYKQGLQFRCEQSSSWIGVLDRNLELTCKRSLFPVLGCSTLRSWVWWATNLPIWCVAYPERASFKS